MLPRPNRVTRASDFRTAVRQGRRVVASSIIVHVLDRHVAEPSRFGFIVTKAVGDAVTRNVVRRRLRAVSRGILPSMGDGRDVVIRALPGSDAVPFISLQAEIVGCVDKGVARG